MSNVKTIIEIHPYDGVQWNVGLANKLRAIISSMKYCEDNDYGLNVVWDMFYKLFPEILNNELFTTSRGQLIVYPMFYPIGQANTKYGGFPKDVDVQYYSNEFPFQVFFNKLIPNENIKEKIRLYSDDLNIQKCFGVHLRLGDFISYSLANNCKVQTIEDYFSKIDKIIDEHDCFYFTSDDTESYSHMKKRYDKKVCYIENKNLNRSEDSNFIDAYVDLVLLSKTKFILGNRFSTFSYHAARIENKKLITCDDEELDVSDIKDI